MKKFAQFIPVALGLLTLASCSNDDLFSEQSQDAVKLEKGDLLVTMTEPQEDGEAFTRGYTSRDMKSRRWYSGVDELVVYGSQFGAFDTYQFKQGIGDATGKFQIVSNPSYVAEPMWALFPKQQIDKGYWELIGGLYNSAASVDVIIPQLVTYDAAYDAANYATNKDPYYLDNLPRWGKIASIHGGDYLQTDLRWMTGILRLQLAGAPKYSNGIRVQMYENGDRTKPIRLNGVYTVKIAQNDEPITGACIEYVDGDYAVSDQEDGALYVHMEDIDKLNDADKDKAVVYLPLPVTPKKQVDIVVSVWDPNNPAGSLAPWSGKVHYTGTTKWLNSWKEKAVYKNKTIKLGNVYGNKSEYNLALDGTNPGAISDALELIETTDDVIKLVANNPIDVCEASKQTTIEIPNKVGKKQIVIDLRNGLDGCDPDQTLNIVYKDVTDKFKGNVTLITPDAPGTNPILLNVDLDETSFSIVQGQALKNDAYGNIDVDAREFVVGNEDPSTPTPGFIANRVKFSENVKKFWVAKEASINNFTVTDAELHSAVNEIVINGVVTGKIDAKTDVAATHEVAVKVLGENAKTQDILTNGTVEINAGLYGVTKAAVDDIEAKSVTATGWTTVGHIGVELTSPITETVSLSGNVEAVGRVVANGNISIIEEANVATGIITSYEGNITIDNAYTPTSASNKYAGAITAEKGIVSLNQTGTEKSFFNGAIIANKFVMTGLTTATDAVTAHGVATINVDGQDGACAAISGTLTFDNPTANTLNLLQGYVKEIVNPAAVETSLTFATTAAYAAIGKVANPDKLIPSAGTVSIWNGDWEINAYPKFGTWGYSHDDGRIWTATQLGYMNKEVLDNADATATGELEIRANIDLDNQNWPGITETDATTINGNDWTISNVKLIGDKAAKAAGFFNTCAADLKVYNLTFDGVQTAIAGVTGGVYAGGIGAVAGKNSAATTLSRVKVKLAGTSFGSVVPVKNAQTGNIGGLIGIAVKLTKLIGCQVDANNVPFTGYNKMGGFIGRSHSHVTIKMEEGDDSQGIAEMYPSVTNLSFNVTYDLTQGPGAKTNDPEQGTTGWFIGSIDVDHNLTITDVQNADIKRDIVQASGSLANEAVASLITSTSTKYYFRRDADKADQTLVGNSGFYTSTPDDGGTPGVYTINGVRYCIYKTKVAVAEADAPRFYSLNLEPYKP